MLNIQHNLFATPDNSRLYCQPATVIMSKPRPTKNPAHLNSVKLLTGPDFLPDATVNSGQNNKS